LYPLRRLRLSRRARPERIGGKLFDHREKKPALNCEAATPLCPKSPEKAFHAEHFAQRFEEVVLKSHATDRSRCIEAF
jgi:hypothetical protein